MRYPFFSFSDFTRFVTSNVHIDLSDRFMPQPDAYDWAGSINNRSRGVIYREAWQHNIQHEWWDDSQTSQTLILNPETNSYYTSNELNHEIDTFFRNNQQALDIDIESPLEPFSIQTIMDPCHLDFLFTNPSFSMLLALALGLGLVLFFLYVITTRKSLCLSVLENRTRAA